MFPAGADTHGQKKVVFGSFATLQPKRRSPGTIFDEDAPPPDASGTYEGEASSADGTTHPWCIELQERDETGLSGQLVIMDMAVVVDLRGTINGDGRIVMIGAAPGAQLRILADFLESQDGSARIEGAFDFRLTQESPGRGPGLRSPVVDAGTFVVTRVAEEEQSEAAAASAPSLLNLLDP